MIERVVKVAKVVHHLGLVWVPCLGQLDLSHTGCWVVLLPPPSPRPFWGGKGFFSSCDLRQKKTLWRLTPMKKNKVTQITKQKRLTLISAIEIHFPLWSSETLFICSHGAIKYTPIVF